jgi:Zn-dependent protease with chaperone function
MELKSILGLLIAAAIPVVMFALWSEYFRNESAEEGDSASRRLDDEESAAGQLTRIRLAGLISTSLQLVIFLSTGPVREESPAHSIAGLVVTLAALVVQRVLQIQLERDYYPKDEQGGMAGQLFPSGMFWAFAGIFIYMGILSGTVFAAAAAVAVFKLDGMPAIAVIGAGGVLGYSLALASNFAISPWLMRRMIPSREVQDQRLAAVLSRCFEANGVNAPEFREIRSGYVRSVNAWMTGFPGLRGPLQPVLWLTPRIVEEFQKGEFHPEFEAVILHEVAHMKLRHLARRFLLAWAMSLTVLAVMAGTLAVNAFYRSQQTPSILPVFSLAAAAALIWASLRLAQRQARAQELEADRCAVSDLGASASGLVRALQNIEAWNAATEGRKPGEPAPSMGSHPATEDRIAALQPLAEAERASTQSEQKAA